MGCNCNDIIGIGYGYDDPEYQYVGNENCSASNQGKGNWKAYYLLVLWPVFIPGYYFPGSKHSIPFLHIYAGLRISFPYVCWFPDFSFQQTWKIYYLITWQKSFFVSDRIRMMRLNQKGTFNIRLFSGQVQFCLVLSLSKYRLITLCYYD